MAEVVLNENGEVFAVNPIDPEASVQGPKVGGQRTMLPTKRRKHSRRFAHNLREGVRWRPLDDAPGEKVDGNPTIWADLRSAMDVELESTKKEASSVGNRCSEIVSD
jgi:hypothetical protein